MKKRNLLSICLHLILAAGLSGASLAADGPVAAGYDASGIVKQVDEAGSKVFIQHDPIKALGWPAMTMAFSIKDKSLFPKLTVGATIQFVVAKQGDDFVVTSIK